MNINDIRVFENEIRVFVVQALGSVASGILITEK